MADIPNYFDLPDWRQMQGARAVGGFVHNAALRAPGYAIGAASRGMDIALPAINEFMSGLTNAPVSSAQAQPASTRNAVAISQKYNQGDVRKTEKGAYNPSAPSTAGMPPGTTGSVSDEGRPYTSRDAGVGGITRVDQAGQSPLFTNLAPGAAVDDMARMRSTPLPSVAGFLSGVKDLRMDRYAPAGAASEGGGGGGGVGMFPPSLQSAIQNYHDLSMKANDGSIAGAWRARGFAKQRDLLLAGAANAQTAGAHVLGANAAMMRAENEPALEGMKNFVQMRGQDLTASTSRANAMDAAAAHRYGSELGFLPHAGQAALEARALKAIDAGDMAQGKELFTMPRFGPQPRNPAMQETGAGNVVIVHPDGRKEVLTPDMQAQIAKSTSAEPYRKRAADEIRAGYR